MLSWCYDDILLECIFHNLLTSFVLCGNDTVFSLGNGINIPVKYSNSIDCNVQIVFKILISQNHKKRYFFTFCDSAVSSLAG